MQVFRAAGLLLAMSGLFSCSTYSTREQRTVTGVAIAVAIVGVAVHGSRKDDNKEHLAESAGRPGK